MQAGQLAAAGSTEPGHLDRVGLLLAALIRDRVSGTRPTFTFREVTMVPGPRTRPRWLGPGLAGYRPVDGRPRPARDPEAYANLLCQIHLVGAAADCIASMAATIERTGIRHLLCMVEGAGDPERTRENIARLGAEVLPVLRQRFGGSGHTRAASGAAGPRAKPGST